MSYNLNPATALRISFLLSVITIQRLLLGS